MARFWTAQSRETWETDLAKGTQRAVLKVEDKFQRTRIAKTKAEKGELNALCPGASARPPTYRVPLLQKPLYFTIMRGIESPLPCELHNSKK